MRQTSADSSLCPGTAPWHPTTTFRSSSVHPAGLRNNEDGRSHLPSHYVRLRCPPIMLYVHTLKWLHADRCRPCIMISVKPLAASALPRLLLFATFSYSTGCTKIRIRTVTIMFQRVGSLRRDYSLDYQIS